MFFDIIFMGQHYCCFTDRSDPYLKAADEAARAKADEEQGSGDAARKGLLRVAPDGEDKEAASPAAEDGYGGSDWTDVRAESGSSVRLDHPGQLGRVPSDARSSSTARAVMLPEV